MYQVIIEVIEHSYPNPEYKYGVFSVAGQEVGRADKRGDGWVIRPGRKVLSFNETAKKMVKNNLADAKKRKDQAIRDETVAKEMLALIK